MTRVMAERRPVVELRGLSKRFVKRLDLAGPHRRRSSVPTCARRRSTPSTVSTSPSRKGEVVGLVGESGCGKSTLGRMVAGMLTPTDGEVLFKGADRERVDGAEAHAVRARDPDDLPGSVRLAQSAHAGRDIVGEAPLVHGIDRRAPASTPTSTTCCAASASIPTCKRRYPHQFSGGQRSRIGIARALAVKPEFLVCDEAVAALDVSIQAQIINLFMDLRDRVRPDLPVHQPRPRRGPAHLRPGRHHVPRPGGRERPDRGRSSPARTTPTRRRCWPKCRASRQRKRTFHPIKGEIPSPLDPPPGCHFHPRCPHAFDRCRNEVPVLKEIAPGRISACHLNDG